MEKGTAIINLHESEIIYGEDQYKVIYKLVDEVKRLSLSLNFRKTSSLKTDVYIGGSYGIATETELLPEVVENKDFDFSGSFKVMAGFSLISKYKG
ncbi:MAG: hypothetical protein LBQ34_03865 [Alphaproteobacteria bacterium]|nr:hypothetical protein [Alphaproteobacteria bacterium]